MDSKKSYIYKDELDGIANNNSISITYLDSRNDLHQEIDKFIAYIRTMVNTLLQDRSQW